MEHEKEKKEREEEEKRYPVMSLRVRSIFGRARSCSSNNITLEKKRRNEKLISS